MIGSIRPLCRSSHRCSLQSLALLSSRAAGTSSLLPHIPHPRLKWCSLHTGTSSQQSSGRDPPPARMKVFYVPNPFKWLHNRMEIATLKREWDPSFDEEFFKFGAAQAVCTISELVSRRDWGDLCGLLSQKAMDKIRRTKWTSDQVNNLVLSPENVQVTQINNVTLQTVVDRKYCDIDVTMIGTRVPYNLDKHSVIVLEYFAR
ncbi:putative m-AAA protease-interacting protein 1-like [Homarus americanus]|uniref:Putative m-AAA protease-interacting protein 1-like n=2 Tax=Homarus americanus TaxID=6706 RepID=A0A8J5MTR8_HOMAM|nr:putative m-AAA protease-interacting protein 1-like [Homarus americanus]